MSTVSLSFKSSLLQPTASIILDPERKKKIEKTQRILANKGKKSSLTDGDAHRTKIIIADLQGIRNTNDQLLHYHIGVSR